MPRRRRRGSPPRRRRGPRPRRRPRRPGGAAPLLLEATRREAAARGEVAATAARAALPAELAIDATLHQLVFSHWDWSAPGAGMGPSIKVRRPRRTTGGMVSGSRTPNYDSGSEADGASGRPRRKRYSQNGWLGWATLLVLIGAYTLVALLPAFHHAGWMPFHLIYWTDEAVSAARASSRML